MTAYKDVSTVVSILPFAVNEKKPGLQPGIFQMPAVKDGAFELLIVERCNHPVYLDEARPRLNVPDPSDIVAQSIVSDLKVSLPGYNSGIAEPGIGWVPGEFTMDEKGQALFKATHSALLKDMQKLQRVWFESLVRTADDDWSRYHRHTFITSVQRHAAMVLGLKNKDWMLEQEIVAAMSKCKFCFSQVDPQAIICPTCHGVLNQVEYEKNFVKATATK